MIKPSKENSMEPIAIGLAVSMGPVFVLLLCNILFRRICYPATKNATMRFLSEKQRAWKSLPPTSRISMAYLSPLYFLPQPQSSSCFNNGMIAGDYAG